MANRCTDCSADCLEQNSDSCLTWTGQSFPSLNITKGKAYSTNIINLAKELEKLVLAEVNLKCLFTDCDGPLVDVPTAVQILIDKICEINTDDIINVSDMSCIAGSATSVEAAYFADKYSTINTTSTSTGGTFTYNLSDVVTGLPSDYSLQKVSVVLRGQPLNGNSVIGSSNTSQGIISIGNTRYPIVADVEARINTPSGIVLLQQNIAVVSSSEKINSLYPLSIKDFGGGTPAMNLTAGISAMAAQICVDKGRITALETVQIADTTDIKFTSKKRDPVLAIIVGELQEVISKVDAPGEFPIFATQCGGECGSTVIESTLQAVLDSYGVVLCNLVSQVNELTVRLATAEQRIRVCCTSDSFDSSSSIGGGSGTVISGPCIGNSCP